VNFNGIFQNLAFPNSSFRKLAWLEMGHALCHAQLYFRGLAEKYPKNIQKTSRGGQVKSGQEKRI
jgi:hypothetical protein